VPLQRAANATAFASTRSADYGCEALITCVLQTSEKGAVVFGRNEHQRPAAISTSNVNGSLASFDPRHHAAQAGDHNDNLTVAPTVR
jgi:3-hydroxyisobutyrate dehydrogenase-like beta-hydroxyacid dehydrogenase